MAVTLKKKTLTIIVIIVFLLSIIATAYIFWTIQKEEDVIPDEGEAGLDFRVGQYGCVTDSDCMQESDGFVECDEVMSHDASKQRCEYYKCKTGYTLSSDRLECIPIVAEKDLHCGEYGCSKDSDCVDDDNECDERTDNDESKQMCVLIESTCPDGYERTSDKCKCEKIEVEAICGDGKINVTGEECESGNPSGVSCSWSECNKVTCKCPSPVCGDGVINVTGEECEAGDPSGVDCAWSSCNKSNCTCPEEVVVDDEEDEGEQLPETGISDISDEMMAFYITFFISGGILVLSYVLESPNRKYQNRVIDKIDE